tara:strand:+ start:358 stop:627 length:270 start_codon:yes stop_codon:yes gene_type:complete
MTCKHNVNHENEDNILIEERTDIIDGYSYHVYVTRGEPFEEPGHPFKDDSQDSFYPKIYLTTYVVDEVNGMTDDYQVFEFTDGLKKLDI